MSDPSTGAVATAAAIGVTTVSLIPGIDGNAVIAAFAGALFFIVFAEDLSPLARLGYFIASWITGYYVSVEAIGQSWAVSSGLPAFGGSLFTVVVCVSLLEWVQDGKTPGWLATIVGWIRPGTRND